MSKKVSETVSKPDVKVKIAFKKNEGGLEISEAGKEVVMSEKDHRFVTDAFRRIKKAQMILNGYDSEEG